MYLFRYNYKLIGKRFLRFVPSTPEEIEKYGEDDMNSGFDYVLSSDDIG